MRTDLKVAVSRGVDHLLSIQEPEGWWSRCPDANVMVDAVDLFIRELLGVRDERILAATARWIRSRQLPDAGWGLYPGGPGDLSTTVEAYLALRLAGDGPEEPHMAAAARFVRGQGGAERCRLEAHLWLALFGQEDWRAVPTVLTEVVLLPPRFPLSLYRLSTWARLAMVPLGLVHRTRPCHDPGFRTQELWTRRPAPVTLPPALRAVNRAVGWYNEHALGLPRRRAVKRAVRWIVDRQEADGAWLACNVASVFCLLGLHAAGLSKEHPAIRAGLRGLDGFAVWQDSADGPVRRMNCMPTPVWDTALCVTALADAGLGTDHPALLRAARWLAGQEVTAYGDWAMARPGRAAGGWSVGFVEQAFPDCDDTAVVIEALSRVTASDPVEAARLRGATVRGTAWLLAMQSSDGGWGAYDADNTSWAASRLSTLDFTELTDRPCPDITAHALESLARQGLQADPRLRAAVRWLTRHQAADGSWFGRWGANHLYGTGAAVTAMLSAGVPPHSPPVRRAIDWLTDHQNPDGGWGESLRSYEDPAWCGRGPSTPSQTSWALLALHAAGLPADDDRVDRGLAWLVAAQREDGGWDEEPFTGTVLPRQFYMSYPLYRHLFPVMALGRYQR
ncbi:squalene--hopene cyclase [Streptomyces sp. Go40/10]|uniref:squalene--hopene cyclase n=1 Tax=Streptomyces sp. Go40/10 TaxID=2825844 RepID=UPI001E56037B|nr:squalene--hopene cyclase [Streptomyces sp. Go40/10]UFQ99960.1 squalene--hopene cyclase [Streptomyces sp. Go40/10]